MARPEVYVSTDIETDGPIPGVYSMLSLASAAFTGEGERLETFSANLLPLDGATTHPETMKFWRSEPAAWSALQTDRLAAGVGMVNYRDWVNALPGRPVFVAYPVGFDFTFVHWYLHRFTGGNPFSHSALDMKTLAMVLLGTGYRDSSKRSWPERWLPDDLSHTHVALDDAIEQGVEFCRMLAEARNR